MAKSPLELAQEAIDQGYSIFLMQLRHLDSGDGLVGDNAWIHAVEKLGWRLERMSHLMGENIGKNALVSVYQFRRDL